MGPLFWVSGIEVLLQCDLEEYEVFKLNSINLIWPTFKMNSNVQIFMDRIINYWNNLYLTNWGRTVRALSARPSSPVASPHTACRRRRASACISWLAAERRARGRGLRAMPHVRVPSPLQTRPLTLTSVRAPRAVRNGHRRIGAVRCCCRAILLFRPPAYGRCVC